MRNSLQSNFPAGIVASLCILLSGCMASIEKDVTATLSASALDSVQVTPPRTNPIATVDVAVGAPVGVAMLPNFGSARARFADAFRIDPNSGQINTFMDGGVETNLPTHGNVRELGGGSLFAFTKLVSGACYDRIYIDLHALGDSGRIVGGLRLNEAANSTTNSANAWRIYYRNLADRLLSRPDVTDREVSILDDLRADIAASTSQNAQSVALAVCIALGTSADALSF